jgi:PilZ domain
MVAPKLGAHMENRKAIRQRVLKSATIEFHRSAFSCAVRNLSESGAALDVPSSVGIPDEFQLVIQANQVTRHCRVIWRKETGSASRSIQATDRDPRGIQLSLLCWKTSIRAAYIEAYQKRVKILQMRSGLRPHRIHGEDSRNRLFRCVVCGELLLALSADRWTGQDARMTTAPESNGLIPYRTA